MNWKERLEEVRQWSFEGKAVLVLLAIGFFVPFPDSAGDGPLLGIIALFMLLHYFYESRQKRDSDRGSCPRCGWRRGEDGEK